MYSTFYEIPSLCHLGHLGCIHLAVRLYSRGHLSKMGKMGRGFLEMAMFVLSLRYFL
jgi:hypothetical protein